MSGRAEHKPGQDHYAMTASPVATSGSTVLVAALGDQVVHGADGDDQADERLEDGPGRQASQDRACRRS